MQSFLQTRPRKLLDFLLSDKPIFAPVALTLSALLCVAYFFDLWAMYFLPALVLACYVFSAFRLFVWLRIVKKRFDGFKRDVGLCFWNRGFWNRVAEHRVENIKFRIATSREATKYLRLEHILAWRVAQLKRKLDGGNRKDTRWDLTFECAYHLRQGLEVWWNGDRTQTKVIDWRQDGHTLCFIVGPNRVNATAVLMPDYRGIMTLGEPTVEKLLDQRFGLEAPTFHQISINDGATCHLRVTSHPSQHLPPGGRKTKNPVLPNLRPLGEV